MRASSSEQEDYLLRLIRQLGQAVARLRGRVAASATADPAVRAEVAQQIGVLLGADASLIERLDAVSAARMVGDPARIELWAQLLEVEAEVWARDGRPEQAAATMARATALRTAAASQGD